MKPMKLFLTAIMLSLAFIFAGETAEAVVTVVKANHFEAGKNLSEGSKASKSDKILSTLLAEQATAINANAAADAKLVHYISGATAGGASSQTVVVTGLGASDTVYSVSQKVKGANSLPLLGWQGQAANSMVLIYSADPGAGAIVDILVKKP